MIKKIIAGTRGTYTPLVPAAWHHPTAFVVTEDTAENASSVKVKFDNATNNGVTVGMSRCSFEGVDTTKPNKRNRS